MHTPVAWFLKTSAHVIIGPDISIILGPEVPKRINMARFRFAYGLIQLIDQMLRTIDPDLKSKKNFWHQGLFYFHKVWYQQSLGLMRPLLLGAQD